MDTAWHRNVPNIGVVAAYQELYQLHRERYPVLIYMHDDLSIYDANWVERIGLEMMDPKVAICGFGGATGIGVPSLYKRPYDIMQLVRTGYVSNQRGWEIHGGHETGERRVAVVDGFMMAIKTSFLDDIGGWSWIQSSFHCYDLAMCLMAHRRGMESRIVGVDCDHHGGGTSTKAAYIDWCKEHATTVEDEHTKPHRWLYEEFRDVLPVNL